MPLYLLFSKALIRRYYTSLITVILLIACVPYKAIAQLELTTGVGAERNAAVGPALAAGYDFKIKGRLFTKLQVGAKYMHEYDDWIGAHFTATTLEFHQTISVEIGRRSKNYLFKPNIGINYRFHRWKGKMEPPYNEIPLRRWSIGVRNGNWFSINSWNPEEHRQTHKTKNFGFSLQLQNQFRLSDKLWLHLTPFMEPDYDRHKNIGGLYVGIVFISL